MVSGRRRRGVGGYVCVNKCHSSVCLYVDENNFIMQPSKLNNCITNLNYFSITKIVSKCLNGNKTHTIDLLLTL